MKLTQSKILITGGGSGIGLGLAARFAQDGNTVIICGRREDALKEAVKKYPSLIPRVCDLSTAADRSELYNWVSKNHSDLNVLVNNAGVQNWMNVSDDNFYERAEAEITTNITAPVHLSNLFLKLPSLKAIMNVTSGLAFVQFAKVPVYCATKAFFHSFTLSLRYQLKDKGIAVIEIIPPALNTDLGGKGLHDGQPEVSDFVTSIFDQLEQGKTELTFGHSEGMLNGGPVEIKARFKVLNP